MLIELIIVLETRNYYYAVCSLRTVFVLEPFVKTTSLERVFKKNASFESYAIYFRLVQKLACDHLSLVVRFIIKVLS